MLKVKQKKNTFFQKKKLEILKLFVDGHIKDVTLESKIEHKTETVYANTININDQDLLLQIYTEGISVIDISKQGKRKLL